MTSRIALVSVVLLALFFLALFNYFWVGVFVLSLVAVAIFVWRWRESSWIKGTSLVLSLVILAMALFTDLLPRPQMPSSITEPKISMLKPLRDSAPADYDDASQPTPPDPVADMRSNFDEARYFPFLQRLPTLQDASTRMIDARETLIALRQGGPEFRDSADRLDQSINDVDESLEDYPPERVEEIEKRIKRHLEEGRTQVYALDSEAELQSYRRRWDAKYRTVALDGLYEDLTQLQESLDLVAEAIIEDSISVQTELQATYHQDEDVFHLDEVIHLAARSPILRAVDLTRLRLASDFGELEQTLLLSYESCEDGTETSNRFEIRRGEKDLCIVNRVVVPARSESIDAPGLLDFVSVDFTWPRVYATKILVDIDLSQHRLQLAESFPYSVELDRRQEISRIVLPRHSYFQSNLSFKPTTTAVGDVLVPRESLTPAYFRRHPDIWIELLPRFPLVRTAWVQERKSYLFPENWTMALLVAAVGAFLTALFKRSMG